MKKFNFKLINGKELKAELIDDKLLFEMSGEFRAKHLIALKPLYVTSGIDFILDQRADMVIPNKTFLMILEELEEETGYIHVRPTVDVVNGTIVIDDRKN
jgi:hypothetical protein